MAATKSKPKKGKRGNPKGKGPSPAARKKAGRSTAKRGSGKGIARKVTPALYAEMFQAYMEKPSARHVAGECGVTWQTAQRVIERGYPKSAMPPLRDRYRATMAEANKKAEYAIADANAQSLILIRGYKSKLAKRITTLKPEELPAALGGELDRMVRLESFLLGGADARPDLTTVSTGVYDGMSYDERIAFLRSGRLPMAGVPEAPVDPDEEGDAPGPAPRGSGRANGSGRGNGRANGAGG